MNDAHAFFVWSAYGLTVAVLLGLTLGVVLDWMRQKQRLERLEAEGAPRRARARRENAGASQ